MFHNMQKKSVPAPIKTNMKAEAEKKGQATQSQKIPSMNVNNEPALKDSQTPNQKSSTPKSQPQPTQLKEEKMNTNPSDNQTNNAQSQEPAMDNRVDIPGNNFNRPMPNAAQAGARAPYPGASYPGANAGAGFGAQAQTDTGRKLVIGEGISLSGEIESCDHLIVEGTVEAALKGASNMDISESGAFYGTVEIEEATIAGRFEGDINVSGRLTVLATGTIIGSVTYKELSLEAGAAIEGSLTPIDSQSSTRSSKKKTSTKSKKVQQDNSAELPFSEKVAS